VPSHACDECVLATSSQGSDAAAIRAGRPAMPVLDSTDPLYLRGFMLGVAWETAWRDGWVQVRMDAEAAGMAARIAEAAGLQLAVAPAGEGLVDVTIGLAP
jgi:hypothetical protein